MKKFLFILLFALFIGGCSCGGGEKTDGTQGVSGKKTIEENGAEDTGKSEMKIIIDGITVNVKWLDNESVKQLKEIGRIEISMRRYGGFEQVGALNRTITSADERITTDCGDIVLYSSNQLVIFFGRNTWSYTKLGKIESTREEIIALLDKESVEVIIIGEEK